MNTPKSSPAVPIHGLTINSFHVLPQLLVLILSVKEAHRNIAGGTFPENQ